MDRVPNPMAGFAEDDPNDVPAAEPPLRAPIGAVQTIAPFAAAVSGSLRSEAIAGSPAAATRRRPSAPGGEHNDFMQKAMGAKPRRAVRPASGAANDFMAQALAARPPALGAAAPGPPPAVPCPRCGTIFQVGL